MHPPAVRGRAGGITEMYYEKIVHQGCLWGRVRSALGPVSYINDYIHVSYIILSCRIIYYSEPSLPPLEAFTSTPRCRSAA